MIILKRAETADAAEITRIKTEAFNQEINTWLGRNGGPPGYDQIASELSIIESCLAYKIMKDERIIGGFFLVRDGEDGMRLEDFVIDPLQQGKGYGYRTLCEIEKMYPEVRRWRLSTPVFSKGNQHLYEKFGYREEARDEEEIYYCKQTGSDGSN